MKNQQQRAHSNADILQAFSLVTTRSGRVPNAPFSPIIFNYCVRCGCFVKPIKYYDIRLPILNVQFFIYSFRI